MSPHDIRLLTYSLGTIDGLHRVNEEIDRLKNAITEKKPVLTIQELKVLKSALDGLSAAIYEMHKTARTILAESGAPVSYVG